MPEEDAVAAWDTLWVSDGDCVTVSVPVDEAAKICELRCVTECVCVTDGVPVGVDVRVML